MLTLIEETGLGQGAIDLVPTTMTLSMLLPTMQPDGIGTGHYVTWILDDKWNTFHGLYHDDLVDAVTDYAAR